MRILDRYLINEFSRSLVLTSVCLLGIYTIIEFFEKIDDVIKSGTSLGYMLRYLFYSLPATFFQLLPVAFLIAGLLTLGVMSRNRELLAMKAAGISLYRATAGILLMAALLSAFSFICQETVLIKSNQLASYYKKLMEGKNPGQRLSEGRIWFWEKTRLFNIQLVNPQLNEVRGIIMFELDPQFRIIRRIDAQRGSCRNGIWYLEHGIERIFSPNDFSKMTFQEFDQKAISLPEQFEDIFALQKLPEEMSYQELSRYIGRLREAGYNVDRYLVDLHTKISTPFITFIIALIGVSFAVKVDRSGRLFNIGLGLLISFIYWVIFYLSISLGRAGALPPILAAWLGNLVFLGLGIYLLMTIPT